jgi:hypothetical protein
MKVFVALRVLLNNRISQVFTSLLVPVPARNRLMTSEANYLNISVICCTEMSYKQTQHDRSLVKKKYGLYMLLSISWGEEIFVLNLEPNTTINIPWKLYLIKML